VIDPVLAAIHLDPCLLLPSYRYWQHQHICEWLDKPSETLAQPMGHNHIRRHEEAQAAADKEKSMKIRQRDLQERLKCTCKVLIWFKVCFDHTAD